ncbi:SAP domain-containing protein [Cryobacterium zongtaii]
MKVPQLRTLASGYRLDGKGAKAELVKSILTAETHQVG